MFKVIQESQIYLNGQFIDREFIRVVYSVSPPTKKKSTTEFLLYIEGVWRWMDSEAFIPLVEEGD